MENALEDVFEHAGPERLVSGGMWFLILMIMSGFFYLALSIIITRFYGPVGYGILNTAGALYNFAWVFIFGGLFQGLMKYGSEYVTKTGWKLTSYFSTALKYMTALGVLMFVILTTVAFNIQDPTLKIITLTMAASFLFSGTKDALAAMIGSFQKSDHLSMLNSSKSVIVLAVGIAFILFDMPANMLPTIIIWGTIWQLGLAIYLLRSRLTNLVPFDLSTLFTGRLPTLKKIKRFQNFKQFTKIAMFGLFISIGMISFNIMKSLDVVVMKLFFDYGDVGIYSVADTASSMLFYMTSFSLPIIPAIAEAYAKKNKNLLSDYVNIAVKYPILIGIPLTLIIMLMAEPIILGFYGPAFSEAIEPLQILIPGTFMLMFGYNLSSILIGIGKSKLSGVLMSASAIQYILSLFILIPLFGFIGAALSLTLTGVTMMLIVPYYLKKEIQISIYEDIHKILAASIAMVAILFIFPKSNFLFAVVGSVLGCAAFVTILYLLGYVTKDDLHMLKIAGDSFKRIAKRE